LTQLPLYRCHKQVRAAKILRIEMAADRASATLTLDTDHVSQPIKVDAQWLRRHEPQVGGYYVIYEPDLYTGFSSAQAFEQFYTRIP